MTTQRILQQQVNIDNGLTLSGKTTIGGYDTELLLLPSMGIYR